MKKISEMRHRLRVGVRSKTASVLLGGVACGPGQGQESLRKKQRKRVGGRVVGDQNTAKLVPENCVFLLKRGPRKKGAEKGLESMVWEGFLAPIPSVRQPLFETSDIWGSLRQDV